MALLDHFHPPLSIRRHWHAFHSAWAAYLASDLNQQLPDGYFAEPNVQFGIEIDVAAFDEAYITGASPLADSASWRPPNPTKTIPFEFSNETVEVTIYGSEAGPTLVGAIELVSPANKDRATHRNTFVSKCETYLRNGISLVIVDVVTNRHANLHELLLQRVGQPSSMDEGKNSLYAAAYRPLSVEKEDQSTVIDIWEEKLMIHQPLPTLPLWLDSTLCLPVHLDATYTRTCRSQKIVSNR